MNTPNALNPGASSTPADKSTLSPQAPQAEQKPTEQAYENAAPGTGGNTPGSRPAVGKENVVPAMMQSTKSDAERGAVDSALTKEPPK